MAKIFDEGNIHQQRRLQGFTCSHWALGLPNNARGLMFVRWDIGRMSRRMQIDAGDVFDGPAPAIKMRRPSRLYRYATMIHQSSFVLLRLGTGTPTA
jgi:hypothetical protein